VESVSDDENGFSITPFLNWLFSMIKFVLILSVFVLAGLLIQISSAITLGMSSERMLESQETILLGNIDAVNAEPKETKYTVNVLE